MPYSSTGDNTSSKAHEHQAFPAFHNPQRSPLSGADGASGAGAGFFNRADSERQMQIMPMSTRDENRRKRREAAGSPPGAAPRQYRATVPGSCPWRTSEREPSTV